MLTKHTARSLNRDKQTKEDVSPDSSYLETITLLKVHCYSYTKWPLQLQQGDLYSSTSIFIKNIQLTVGKLWS